MHELVEFGLSFPAMYLCVLKSSRLVLLRTRKPVDWLCVKMLVVMFDMKNGYVRGDYVCCIVCVMYVWLGAIK